MLFYHATPSYVVCWRFRFSRPTQRFPNKLKTQLVSFFNYVFHSTSGTIPPSHRNCRPFSSCDFTGCNRFLFFSLFFFFFSTHFYRFAPPVGVYTTHHTYTQSLLYVYRIPLPGFDRSRLSLICFVCVFLRPFPPHCLYAEIYQPLEQRQQRIYIVILIPSSAGTSAEDIWRNRAGIAKSEGDGERRGVNKIHET